MESSSTAWIKRISIAFAIAVAGLATVGADVAMAVQPSGF